MISVCLATYNGERYIRQQVDSILDQLNENDELIVSDDGSSDSTLDILQSYNDDRIIILHNDLGKGVNKNFENALRHAKGDYIFLSDQDDVWLPDKVEECVAALQNADCVVHDAVVVDSNLKTLDNSFFATRKSGTGFLKNIYRNTYLGCCMAFRKNVLKDILPIPPSKSFYHDNWIGGIIDLKYKMVFIPYKGILFRRHNKNVSFTAKSSKYSLSVQVWNRAVQVYYTLIRVI